MNEDGRGLPAMDHGCWVRHTKTHTSGNPLYWTMQWASVHLEHINNWWNRQNINVKGYYEYFVNMVFWWNVNSTRWGFHPTVLTPEQMDVTTHIKMLISLLMEVSNPVACGNKPHAGDGVITMQRRWTLYSLPCKIMEFAFMVFQGW